MDALSEALPLALSAAIYPPALLVLLLLMTGEHPRRLVLAYFAGAALMVVGAGLVALAVLNGSGATSQSSQSASAGVQIVVGLALLALATWLWRRRTRRPDKPVSDQEHKPGRIGQWSQRALALLRNRNHSGRKRPKRIARERRTGADLWNADAAARFATMISRLRATI